MASAQGSLVFMQYRLGTTKGGVGSTTFIQNETPFTFGAMTEDRSRYTSEKVVEAATAGTGAQALAWTTNGDIVHGAISHTVSGVTTNYDIKLVKSNASDIYGYYNKTDKKFYSDAAYTNQITVAADTKVAYVYDNETIPQDQLPTVTAQMANINLAAHARRIAVYYSQFAAFQSKQDYGIDFESTIAQQAQAELQYEIDAEAVYMIKNAADTSCTSTSGRLFTWTDELLDTISYSMKAEGFAKKINEAKMGVYKATQRLTPNWMLVSPDMLPILAFVPGWKESGAAVPAGPYVAGEVLGLKVIVSPALGDKVCYLGVLGSDGKTGVGVYAPYMPLVPTQLLGFADGGMSQGFSSMYDMQIINDLLLAKIAVTDGVDGYEGYAKMATKAVTEI